MIFLNSASPAAALVFYLPGVCTHTDTAGKQRQARVRNILKSWERTQNRTFWQFFRQLLKHFLQKIKEDPLFRD